MAGVIGRQDMAFGPLIVHASLIVQHKALQHRKFESFEQRMYGSVSVPGKIKVFDFRGISLTPSPGDGSQSADVK